MIVDDLLFADEVALTVFHGSQFVRIDSKCFWNLALVAVEIVQNWKNTAEAVEEQKNLQRQS